MKEYSTNLWVNKEPMELNHFTAQFLAHTVIGAASSLRGVAEVKTLELIYEQSDLNLAVSGKRISLSDFPVKIITGTLKGMIGSLKGVESTDDFKVTITLQG